MTSGIFELTAIILIASALGIIAKLLKQPIILAYLATGAIIGYFGFFDLSNKETFKIFSEMGIMFLLFLVGLEINYNSLRLVGKSSLIIGFSQVVLTIAAAFFLATALNFNYLQAAYISFALTISSTVIIVKLLSDKKDLNSLYGKISIGVLLVEDFLTIVVLFLLSGIESGGFDFKNMTLVIAKGTLLFALVIYLGKKILPLIFDKISRSQELLFLTSLAWLFSLVAITNKIGFSIEIGGLLAGLALANSSEHFQISGYIRSLRDFFLLIFFVIMGYSMAFSNFHGLAYPIIIFSLFVLIVCPLIVIIIMGLLGFRSRTSFLTGLTMAQVSEFSFILAALGSKINHLDEKIVAIITAVGITTIAASSYMIIYGENIYKFLSPVLKIFERKKIKENGEIREFEKPIILIGCHRTGQNIAANISKEDLLIIDFDPEVIDRLKKQNFDYIFGDIADKDIFEAANFNKARLVISTSPELEDNLFLLSELNKLPNRDEIKIVLRARTETEAKILYNDKADYVIIPHFTAGQYLGKTINIDPELKILEQLKAQDLEIIGRNGN
ncbi:cation:proton antiporter [Candidatus Wolfebacteria bacterium]|nr:cation:proton antiporter [Candidatus Wolfebacteria bacterium]